MAFNKKSVKILSLPPLNLIHNQRKKAEREKKMFKIQKLVKNYKRIKCRQKNQEKEKNFW